MPAVRALKCQVNQATRRHSLFTVLTKDTTSRTILESNRDKLGRLAGLAELRFTDDLGGRPGSLTGLGTIALELSGNVDVGAEKVRLGKELEKLEKAVAGGEAKLSNEAFVSKAPPAILEGARKQLDEVRGKRDEIARMIAALG